MFKEFEEEDRLRDFMKDNFPFASFKKMGIFKDLDKNDYKKQAERICDIFGYESVYEYTAPEFYPDSSFVSGKFPDEVNKSGELAMGSSFHISWAALDYDIVCSICECAQTVSVSTSTGMANKKCKGCKRKIAIKVSNGVIQVTER